MGLRFLLTGLVMSALALCGLAKAAEFNTVGNKINISGNFEDGDAQKVEALLQGAANVANQKTILSFDSETTNYAEAIRLANLLRENGVPTLVEKGKSCLYACAVAFLGGTTLENGPRSDRSLEAGADLAFLSNDEATASVTALLQQLAVPDTIYAKILNGEGNGGIYNATTVEAIELLEINVEGLSVAPKKITRDMAINTCLNNFRLLQKQLPSATFANDIEQMERNITQLRIAMPAGANSDFAAIPTLEFGDTGVAVCRISKEGECQGYFPPSSLETATVGELPLGVFPNCDRQSNIWTFTAPDVKLKDIDQTLRDYQEQQAALLGGETAPPTVPVDPKKFTVENEEPRDMVVCNSKFDVANIRSGPNSKAFPVVATLKNGTKITVTGITANPETGHNWVRVEFGEGTGFIDSDYALRDCAQTQTTQETSDNPSSLKLTGEVLVCNPNNELHTPVYEAPDTFTDVKTRMMNYEPIDIVGTSGTFYHVDTRIGHVGYVKPEHVKKSCNLPSPMKGEGGSGSLFGAGAQVICNPDKGFTTFYKKPDRTSGTLIGRLNNNADIMVKERITEPVTADPWFKIEDTKGRKGFVIADHVSNTPCN